MISHYWSICLLTLVVEMNIYKNIIMSYKLKDL